MLRWIVPQLVVSGIALILAFVPLFWVLGFEFSVAMATVFAYVSGWMAIAHAHAARRQGISAESSPTSSDERAFPGGSLVVCLVSNLALLPLPAAIALLNGFRVANCDVAEGLAFYATLCVPAVLFGTALGFLLGLRLAPVPARLLFVLWSLASVAWALWNVVREPPIFAFNAFVAYFPGPVYDRIVPLDARLILARSLVLLESVVLMCASVVFWDGDRLRSRGARTALSGWRAAPTIIGCGALLAFLLVQWHADTLGLRIKRATIQAELGGRIETDHCIVYYARSAYTPERAAELATEHEFHYAELRDWFGTQPQRKVRSYVYATPKDKKRLMGAAGTNFEDALNDEFHINADRFPHPILRHEMAHIFAAQINAWWPVCPLMGIHEGLAVAAEWRQAADASELTPDEACVAMQALGVLPDLERTLGAFGFWTQASARAYTVCGSFMHYLVEEYGMPAMHQLWGNRDFQSTYGKPLAVLIGDWQQRRLDPIHLTARQMQLASQVYLRRSVFQEPCAHEQARLRRDALAALSLQPRVADSLYARLAEIEPNRAEARLGQLRARLRQRDATAALQMAEDLWNSGSLSAADSSLAARWSGDAMWLLGDHAAAEGFYEQAFQNAASRPTRRALQVNRSVLQSPTLSKLLRDYLIESNQSDTASLTLLATARAQEPDSVWPAYLLGRRLYYAERFDEAIGEFQQVLESPVGVDIRLATVELLAWSLLRSGHALAARNLAATALSRRFAPTADSTRSADLPRSAGVELPAGSLQTLVDQVAALELPWTSSERLRLEDLRRRAEARQR